METAHTDGDPPSLGSTIFANIGWTENRSMAETNSVAVKTPRMRRVSPVVQVRRQRSI